MTTDPTATAPAEETASLPSESGKGYLIEETKALLLEQHQSPETDANGTRLTRFEQGAREGQIRAYLDVILNLDGPPAYSSDTEPDTLRKMLLGQALTEHYGA